MHRGWKRATACKHPDDDKIQTTITRQTEFLLPVCKCSPSAREMPGTGKDKLCAGRSGHVGVADSGGGDHRKEGKAREWHSRWKVWQKQRQQDRKMHSARGADSTWELRIER